MTTGKSFTSCLFHSLAGITVVFTLGLSWPSGDARTVQQVSARHINQAGRPTDDGKALDRLLHERRISDSEDKDDRSRLEKWTSDDNSIFHLHNVRFARKRRSNTAMTKLQKTYGEFYDSLTLFLSQYPSHLLPAYSNTPLKDVAVILELFPKDASAFGAGQVKSTRQGIERTRDMTDLVLNKSGAYLKSDAQTWFADQKTILEFKLLMVNFSLAYLGNGSDVEKSESGIGGGNTGDTSGKNAKMYDKLKSIAQILTAK